MMYFSRAAAALLVLLFMVGSAAAQMGPDYWQVTGVASDDHLNMRSGPGTSNRVVAIAPNGAVLRNLGCRGEGGSRWCNVETLDGQISGWVSGRYLQESGAPGGGVSVAAPSGGPQGAVPELHMRATGEFEVRFASGCTALYNPVGRLITAGASCSGAQRARAADAVASFMREQAPGADHGAASANVDLRGTGTIYGGAALTGQVTGHAEGAYALVVSGEGLYCTALLQHTPGSVGSETTTAHCADGAGGSAVFASNRSGNGFTMTLTLSNGVGGYVIF